MLNQDEIVPSQDGFCVNTYVVWNNKGGVGKSTIVFNLAARFAQLHPNRKVLVLDLCPQANATMTLLGGGHQGENHLLNFQMTSASVVGYIDERINAISGQAPQQRNYHLQVSQYNQYMPNNLWLVPGDGNLELIAPAINYYANAQMPANAWSIVHRWVAELIGRITGGGEEWAVFIDTNPSFSIYTELAMIAGTHLLVPFKADDSSRVATRALFALLYGSTPPHPVYGRYTFATRVQDAGFNPPLCHMFIGNQFTQYRGAAAAFRSMSEAVLGELFEQYRIATTRYTDRGVANTEHDFQQKFVYELRDFNSAGVVAAHQGRLLNQLAETNYTVHDNVVPLDRGRITACVASVDYVVSNL